MQRLHEKPVMTVLSPKARRLLAAHDTEVRNAKQR